MQALTAQVHEEKQRRLALESELREARQGGERALGKANDKVGRRGGCRVP